MATELITNTALEACSFGWIHSHRASTLPDIPSLPDPASRRLTSINLSMHSPEDLFSHGQLLKTKGEYKSAIEAFSSASKLRWSFTAAYVEAGNCASLLRDFNSALSYYSAAIETDRLSPVPCYNIALTHSDLGNHDESIAWFKQTIEVDSEYRPAYLHLAQQHAAARRDRLAISLLIKATYIKPHLAAPLVEAGKLYYQNTFDVEAIRCFEKAIQVDPWNSDAYFHLGFAQCRRGEFARAVRSLSFAVNCDQKNKLAAALLKSAYAQLKPKRESLVSVQVSLFTNSVQSAA